MFSNMKTTLAAMALALVTTAGMAQPSFADHRWHRDYDVGRHHQRVLKFDVAEEHTLFFFDQNGPKDDNGLPAAGNAFITEGYIYPHGFLDDSDGTLPEGGPSDPDKVIGRWICRGYFIGDGATATSGAWVATTQYYEFGDRTGRQSFSTEGLEIADIGTAVKRGITGGTGRFKRARGEARQTLLGFQATDAVKLRFRVVVR